MGDLSEDVTVNEAEPKGKPDETKAKKFVPQVELERNAGMIGRIGAYAVRMGIVSAEFVTGGLVGSNGSKGSSYIGGFSGVDNLHFVGGVRIKGEAKGAMGV